MNLINRKFKQTVSIILILVIIISYSTPIRVLADTPTPSASPTQTQTTPTDTTTPSPSITTTPTPSITVTPTPTNSTTPSPSISTTPSPSSDPSITPTPSVIVTPTPTDTTLNNSAEINNVATDSANTGTNTINATTSGSISDNQQTSNNSTTSSNNDKSSGPNNNSSTTNKSSSSNSNISTGNANANINNTNTVNTNEINSQVITQTINIFVDYNGDLNLSDPATFTNNLISQHPTDPQINVALTSSNNYTYLTNVIVSSANTGNNQINSNGSTSISTGAACSLVSLLNQVNLTVINSVVHLVTINVFGNLNGNIILPENISPSNSNPATCPQCGVTTTTNNTAAVKNNVESTANSGNNSLATTDASASSSLTTGNSGSAVNELNLINTNIYGVDFGGVYITILGNWDGNFLGWNGLSAQNGGTNLNINDLSSNQTSSSYNSSATINNTAVVNNNIISYANTGRNTINSANGSIHTGNAFSSVSLFNLINTNIINSWGFFGFINIFTNWKGNIGGLSEFITPTPTQVNPSSQSNTLVVDNNNKEDGGALLLSESSNTGAYILPGDTLTVFLNGKNTGTGKVYGTTLTVHLMYNGQDLGDPSYTVGDMPAGKIFKLTTGLKIASTAQPGTYTLHAVLTGTTGNSNTPVTATADTNFVVYNGTNLASANVNNNDNNSKPDKPMQTLVLGKSTINPTARNDSYLLGYLLLSVILFLLIKVSRNKAKLIALWNQIEKRVVFE